MRIKCLKKFKIFGVVASTMLSLLLLFAVVIALSVAKSVDSHPLWQRVWFQDLNISGRRDRDAVLGTREWGVEGVMTPKDHEGKERGVRQTRTIAFLHASLVKLYYWVIMYLWVLTVMHVRCLSCLTPLRYVTYAISLRKKTRPGWIPVIGTNKYFEGNSDRCGLVCGLYWWWTGAITLDVLSFGCAL